MQQSVFECFGRTLAVTMTMESFNPGWQSVRKLRGHHAETGTGRTRIVQVHFYLRILRIDAQPARDTLLRMQTVVFLHARIETGILAHGIERDMTAAREYLVEITFRIRRRISMCLATELFRRQTGLVEGTGRGMADVFPENRERFP